MKTQLLGRLLAFAVLLTCTGPLLAQGTMETRQGSRHAGPGTVSESASGFSIGITRDNGASFVSTASVSDTVEIRGEIRPEPANIGQTGDLFVVDRLVDENNNHISFSMRTADNVWLPWNGTVSLLVPFQENVTLKANHEVTLFSGTLGTEGEHRIFIGYMGSDGFLRYHTSALRLTITAAPTQTPREQAQALFAAKIHTNIVQNNCIACHVAGDLLTGGVHQFVPGTGQAQIDANFQAFSGMIGRGKDYILGKVRGENAHLGGAVLPQGFPGYSDFEQFLTLLEQR